MKHTNLALALTVAFSGCDVLDGLDGNDTGVDDTLDDDVDDKIDDVPDVPENPALAAAEAKLFDVLECQEIARPSTLDRVRDVLHDPQSEEVQALLLNPTDLATVVAEAGLEVEIAIIVLQNLYRVATDGTMGAVLANGWDALEVGCGAPVTVSCTAGTSTTTVTCDAAEVTAVNVAFDSCVFDGSVRTGDVTLLREADEGRATLVLDGFTVDEVERFEGALSVAIGADHFDASADEDAGFTVVSHGGLASDVSCGEETRVDVAHLHVEGDDASLELDALKVGKDDQWAVKTFGEHLHFSALSTLSEGGCRCPDAGSGLEIDVPRPLAHPNETAKARVSWTAASNGSTCRGVEVELRDWPTSCAPLDANEPDCAEADTARVMAGLFGALCAK